MHNLYELAIRIYNNRVGKERRVYLRFFLDKPELIIS